MLWFVGEGEGKGGGQVGSPLARWKGIRSSSATVIVTVERSLLTGTLRGPGPVVRPFSARRYQSLPLRAAARGSCFGRDRAEGRRGGSHHLSVRYAAVEVRRHVKAFERRQARQGKVS